MITLVVMSSYIYCGGWDLGRNGMVGFVLVFLLFMASLVVHRDYDKMTSYSFCSLYWLWRFWISFFVWIATWEKILTRNNLIKKGYTLVGWCCMWQCSGEIIDHLLIHYDVSYGLWSLVFITFGIHWGLK